MMSVRTARLLGVLATVVYSAAGDCDNSATDVARCENPDCFTGHSGAYCCTGDCYAGVGSGYFCKTLNGQVCYTQYDIVQKIFEWCDCPPAPPATTSTILRTTRPPEEVAWWEVATQPKTTRPPAGEFYERDLNQIEADRLSALYALEEALSNHTKIVYVTMPRTVTTSGPTESPQEKKREMSAAEGPDERHKMTGFHYAVIAIAGVSFLGILYCLIFSESVTNYWTPICYGKLEAVHVVQQESSSSAETNVTMQTAEYFTKGENAGMYADYDEYGIPHKYADGSPLTAMQVQALYKEMAEQREIAVKQQEDSLLEQSKQAEKATLEEKRKRASLAVSPEQHFMRGGNAGKFSEFDARGIPTVRADGSLISKFDRKTMLNEMAAHEKSWKKNGGGIVKTVGATGTAAVLPEVVGNEKRRSKSNRRSTGRVVPVPELNGSSSNGPTSPSSGGYNNKKGTAWSEFQNNNRANENGNATPTGKSKISKSKQWE